VVGGLLLGQKAVTYRPHPVEATQATPEAPAEVARVQPGQQGTAAAQAQAEEAAAAEAQEQEVTKFNG
jgi:hypothetical protein